MVVYRKDFIEQLRSECGYTKQAAKDIVDDFWRLLVKNVADGNELVFTGDAKFTYVHRPARTVHGVDGKKYVVPAHESIRFEPGKSLRDAIKAYSDSVNGDEA